MAGRGARPIDAWAFWVERGWSSGSVNRYHDPLETMATQVLVQERGIVKPVPIR